MTNHEPAMYDAERGGAIWNRQMSRDDGTYVAAWMVSALRDVCVGATDGHWQTLTLERAYPDATHDDAITLAVGSNVLIIMHEDFKEQLAEARARGDVIPTAVETVGAW